MDGLNDKIHQEEIIAPLDDPINDQSVADQSVDFKELIRQQAFLGEVSFEAIIEGLRIQFEDYINIEDKTDYVDIFYDQLHTSYTAIASDDAEGDENEYREVLDELQQSFLNAIADLFNIRLTLSIIPLEDDDPDNDGEIEDIIRKLYNFFILDAKSNFKEVIVRDVYHRIKSKIEDDQEYFRIVKELLQLYSPLVTGVTPEQFLEYCKAEDIIEFFNDGKITGNFLRRYTPKLYQNEEFECELITAITIAETYEEEMKNGYEQ
ncbi:MAG: hypothetical protein NC548_28360 [Lachnospiraceae bacterium]|nr:hypothetical protein [Lachnospiraceae bacterium]MCM1232003.1 hypothetical protein [Ruminococcus flavefaciens]